MVNRVCEEASQIIFAVILYLTFTILIENDDVVQIAGAVAVAVLAFAIYRIDERIESTFVFCLILVLGALIFTWIQFQIRPIPVVLSVSFLMMFRCMLAREKEWYQKYLVPNVGSFVVITICYMVVESFQVDKAGRLVLFLSMVYLLILIYYGNARSLKTYIKEREGTTVMAEGVMKKMTSKWTARYVTMLAIVLIIVTRFSYGNVYVIISGLFSGTFSDMEFSEHYEESIILTPLPTEELPIHDQEYKEPEEMKLQALVPFFKAVLALSFIAIVAAILFLIVAEMTRKSKKDEDNEEMIETRKKLIRQRKPKNKEQDFVECNANKEIRKLYKRKMKGFWKETGVTKEDKTPTEQRELKNSSGSQIEEAVVELYEAARYSKEELGREDVKRFKELLK
ncbi:MAG: hypothetical protein Q4F05_01335 [bacterium]|nr:hypothetical protein [bacterium]